MKNLIVTTILLCVFVVGCDCPKKKKAVETNKVTASGLFCKGEARMRGLAYDGYQYTGEIAKNLFCQFDNGQTAKYKWDGEDFNFLNISKPLPPETFKDTTSGW